MTDFGTIGYGTLEPGNGTQEEQISFSGVTQNSNGTATLTGVSTVLFISPYTEASGLAKTHAGSTTFVISNTAGFYDKLTGKDDDETINGLWTFTQSPVVPDPLGLMDAANKEWVLSVVNGGDITTNALIEAGTAGELVSAGQVVYLKGADGRWWKANASTAATVNNVQLGIAQGTGTAGNPITGGVLRQGLDTNQTGGSAGSNGYVANGGGAVGTSAGTNERAIGQFLDATNFIFSPDFYYIPTDKQKAAFVGNSGTPSSSNKFVTENYMTTIVTDVQTFNSSGTWTKPSGSPIKTLVQVWGAGGSGGKHNSQPSAGGGGGSYVEGWFPTASLGATAGVTVGAGGASKTATGPGNPGGSSSFGSLVTAYGGGGGSSGSAGADSGGGGGGGGQISIGSVGTTIGGNGGSPLGGIGATGASAGGDSGTGGGGGGLQTTGGASSFGGGGGGGNAQANGGSSVYGGGGGGGAGSGATGGTGGTSEFGGAGGVGGTSATSGTQPAGGGGGGNTTNSGAGGDGRVIVTTFF